MQKKGQHVVPRDGKWGVLRSGGRQVSRVFNTQAEAISHARDQARKEGTELYIHGKNGRIRERDSYGNDPHPPKG